MKTDLRRVFVVAITIVFCFVSANETAALGPVRIGATVSFEGKYREPSLMIQQAYRLWVKDVNDKGGLLGRTVELVLYDDKSRPDRTRKLYTKMIVEDEVDLVFSPYSTPLTIAASEVSEQYGFTMLACASAGTRPWKRGYKYLFGMYAPADRMFVGVLDLMAMHNYASVAVVYDATSSFNVDTAEGVEDWARRFGLDMSYRRGYDSREAIAEIVGEVKRADVHGLIVSAYSPDCYLLLDQLEEQRFRPPVLAMTIAPNHPDFYKNAGEIANGIFAPSQWEPDERIPFPGTKRFIAAFKAFTGNMPSYHAGSAYAACQLYEKAIAQVNSLDNDLIRNYIASLDTVTVIGRFKVDHTGKQVGHNAFNIQWQNGKKEIIWPSKMRTAEPLL